MQSSSFPLFKNGMIFIFILNNFSPLKVVFLSRVPLPGHLARRAPAEDELLYEGVEGGAGAGGADTGLAVLEEGRARSGGPGHGWGGGGRLHRQLPGQLHHHLVIHLTSLFLLLPACDAQDRAQYELHPGQQGHGRGIIVTEEGMIFIFILNNFYHETSFFLEFLSFFSCTRCVNKFAFLTFSG